MRHVPVLRDEVVDSLQLAPGMNIVDSTLGDGGHAERILEKTAPSGRLLGIDADPESLARAKNFLYGFGDRVAYVRDNFENLGTIVRENAFGPIHGILLDLGWSSPQFEERGRGFSFEKDELLDMRYGKSADTAHDILNTQSVGALEEIFRRYGEEPLSAEIAQAIIEARGATPLTRTSQLVESILSAYRKKLKTKKDVPWIGGLHPATKVFQALRIAVNDELGVLARVLPQAIDVLAPGGRLAVITFHSVEDRIVKHFFKDEEKRILILTKKPIVCGREEYEKNPSSRSAKLRVIEKL